MYVAKKSKSVSRREKIQKEVSQKWKRDSKPLAEKELSEAVSALSKVAKQESEGIVFIALDDDKQTKLMSFGGKKLTGQDAVDYVSAFIAAQGFLVSLIAMKSLQLQGSGIFKKR